MGTLLPGVVANLAEEINSELDKMVADDLGVDVIDAPVGIGEI